MRVLTLVALLFLPFNATFLLTPSGVMAQEEPGVTGEYSEQTLRRFQSAPQQTPDMPEAIQAIVARGAQARYLGFYEGMHGWMTIQQGRPSFYYVTPNGQAIIRGFMFDRSGEMVTGEQITQLRMREGAQMMALSDIDLSRDAEAEDGLAEREAEMSGVPALDPVAAPAEPDAAAIFMQTIDAANAFVMGDADKPLIHAFIDPNCDHCRDFMRAIIPYIEQDFVALRVIPVGFDAPTRQRAAYLLSAANPGQRLSDYIAGDSNALQPLAELAEDGVMQNIRVMAQLRLDVTPIIVYATMDGQPKIIRGIPRNIQNLVSDVIKG